MPNVPAARQLPESDRQPWGTKLRDRMTLDVELSRTVTVNLSYVPRNRHCFTNAYNALRYFSEGDSPRYVEGWVKLRLAPGIRHAWVETRDGRIVDITPIYLDHAGEVEYVPVRRYTVRQLADHLSRSQILPIGPFAESTARNSTERANTALSGLEQAVIMTEG